MGKEKKEKVPEETMAVSYRKKLSAFYHRFLIFENLDKKFFEDQNLLTDYAFKDLAAFLIEQEIFESVSDFKNRALVMYHIIVPDWIFEFVDEGEEHE